MKLEMVTFQATCNNHCPYLQVSWRAQSKNENSHFNKNMSEAYVKVQDALQEVGYNISHLLNTNNGVSSNLNFVAETNMNFVEGKILLLL